MGHYKSNLRDLQFNLFEFLNLPQGLTGSNYEGLTKADIEQILIEVDKFATGPLAEFFAETDRNPPTYDPQTFSVHIPTPFKQTIKQVLETGWHTVGIPSELAGIPAPRAIVWSVAEMFLGAQPAAYIYMAGAPFSRIFYDNGTAEQKEWAKIIAQRKWAATMVMTEPAAGSDVGASTTKAVQQPDGSWHLTGVKRFITSGDVDDMFENIFHLVLARPGGAPAGTKGLSLFFVPKWLFDFDTQTRGERNGVFATNLEHKMGLKASATCELTFGLQGIPAKGWLVGEVHQGIAQMFKLIEYARMTVGTKAIATLSTGYLNALEFAKQRVQGSDIVKFGDKSAPKVTIIHHPDIRRSLMMQKVYAEGLRALYLYTSLYQDEDVAKALFGVDADLARRVNDLLLPVVKGAGSEQAYEKLTESLQCLGGSGFLQDYPLEQYIRDAKIDSLYEGTTAIQAQDFIFRKIFKDQSVALTYIFQQITAFINEQPTDSHLYPAVENLQTALTNFQNIMVTLTEYLSNTATDTRMLQKIGLVSVRVLLAFGDLMIGWLLLAQAQVAAEKLAGGESLLAADKTFYEGKIMGARFFSQNVLPLLDSLQSIVSKIDTDIMELDESAF